MLKNILIAGLLVLASTQTFANETAHHIPGVFIGATHADSETEMSFGIEYEYKLSELWGTGIVFEKTNDAHHGDGADVYLAMAYVHPWNSIRLGLGYGKEDIGGAHGGKEDLYRVESSYDFHVGSFMIAPTLAFDFVDGETHTVTELVFLMPF
ncbi:hypothetical protein [Thalassotalea atypica]|uniref:hypothetical protein n=1 Tax=Thalassotalea atypica TaxID=2054316 RepID=UPI002573F9F9|nr:hypothetical protein [Thalassotalea atypica]